MQGILAEDSLVMWKVHTIDCASKNRYSREFHVLEKQYNNTISIGTLKKEHLETRCLPVHRNKLQVTI